jgi:predicted permease
MEIPLQDFRYALRQLIRTPGLSVAVALILAVGIGASTMIFGFANWVALRPVPGVSQSARLVTFEFQRPGTSSTLPSYPDLEDFRQSVPALSGIAAYNPVTFGVSSPGIQAREVEAELVTSTFFQVLGVRLAAGTGFTPEQERSADVAPVAVLGYGLARKLFGNPKSAVGRYITLNGLQTSVAGVAPEGFSGPELLGEVELWAPAPIIYPALHLPPAPPPGFFQRRRGGAFNTFIGRMTSEANPDMVARQLQAVGQRILTTYPSESGGYRNATAVVRVGLVGRVRVRESLDTVVRVLLIIGVLLFGIAGANVANLILLRLAANQDQVAIQRALGAGTGRLIRQRLAQTFLIALGAGPAALLAAFGLLRFFTGTPVNGMVAVKEIQLDWRALGFATALSLLAALLLGLLPAFWERRIDVLSELKRSGTRSVTAAPRFRRALSVVQLGMSVALLVTALLFLGTLRNLRHVEIGFDPKAVTAFWFLPRNAGYGPDSTLSLFRRIVPAVRAIPGVEEVAVSNFRPFMGFTLQGPFFPDGVVARDTLRANTFIVSGTYFRTLGIPLLAGRTFTDAEDAVPPISGKGVVVISERAAQRFFGTVNVIGRSLVPPGPLSPVSKAKEYEVIGVVRDTKADDLTRDDQDPTVYRPLNEAGSTMILLVRAEQSAGIRKPITDTLTALGPAVPISSTATLAESLDDRLGEQRLFVRVTVLGTLIAVLLAVVGVYAVTAFSVAERRREFGIRLSLGAQQYQVTEMVLRESLWLAAFGVVSGLTAAAVFSRLIANRLFGISPLDPGVYLGSAVALAAVVMAACYFPARAATQVDPSVVLRNE